MSNPLNNPTPSNTVPAYRGDGVVTENPDGSQAAEVVAKHLARTTERGPQPGSGVKATDLAKPDLRGQSRHPATGQFRRGTGRRGA